jgi:hypothetical protein
MKARKTKKVATKLIREKNVVTLAQKAAKFAVKKAAKRNVSVTVADSGKIYRLHPNGRKELVSGLPPKVKVKNSTIKIAH